MEKSGRIWLVIGIVFLALILIAGGVVFYLYQFHVFKTLSVCVSEDNFEDTNVSCESDGGCWTFVENTTEYKESAEMQLPGLISNKIDEVFDYAVYCDTTCKFREIRGIEDMEEEIVCIEGEKEFLLKIRGKEALAIWSAMKEIEESN